MTELDRWTDTQLAPPAGSALAVSGAGPTPVVHPRPVSVHVHIRSLGPSHRARIGVHLKALAPADRYLRFGHAATDEQIERYVDSLDFDRDDIFGIYNRKLELLAVAHLARNDDPQYRHCVEFGVSVLHKARGRGYGGRLFERAVMHARNEGVRVMFIHALSENVAMLKIARHAGAKVERDGAESDAFLNLQGSTFETRMAEMVEEQLAQVDYGLKLQAKQFREFLATVQEIRSGAQAAQHAAAE